MMVLAELLSNFLPGRSSTRRDYLLSCLFVAVLSVLIFASIARFYSVESEAIFIWSSVLIACEVVGLHGGVFRLRDRIEGSQVK